MAKLFVHDRFVPAWLAASRHLNGRAGTDLTDRNLVLEVARPEVLVPSDHEVLSCVDAVLRPHFHELNVKTVAATIFPAALYKRHGRAGMYKAYKAIMARAKVPGTWGTYALRMMAWPARQGQQPINQLEQTINKLERAAHGGHPFQSAFEVGLVSPDSCSTQAFACEVPTFDPAKDGRKLLNMPCLSHLSFKLTERESVDLTAVYRSHHYAARALGNLLGLSQLQAFVAKEAKLKVGVLTCVSTHAELDLSSWGGVVSGRRMLTSLPKV
jgi:hypothetical protein